MNVEKIFERVLGKLGIIEQLNRIEERLNIMPTKDDLDAAVAQVKQDAVDAAQRAGTALGALIDKINAGEDFTQEVNDLKATHNELVQIAASAAGTNASNTPSPAPAPAVAPAAPAPSPATPAPAAAPAATTSAAPAASGDQTQPSPTAPAGS